MKYLLPVYFFLIIIVSSCNNDTLENNEVKLSPVWATIDIDTKQHALAYNDKPSVVLIDHQEFYANYNPVTHSLNYYNLESKSFEKKIAFYKSGPNKIQSLSIYNLKGDTILVKTTTSIKLFNAEGRLIEELELKDLCPELDENYSIRGSGGIVITNLQRLHIDESRNNLILRVFNKQDAYKDIYKKACFFEYNLDTKHGNVLYVEFPEEVYKEYYGDLEFPNIISKGDSVIYNFPFKAVVYIYNKKDRSVEKKEFKAENIPSVVKGARLSQKDDMMLKRTFFLGEKYHQIDYDPIRDLYYMLYSEKKIKKMPIKKYLVVFNNQLEKLGEVEIKSELSSKFAISKSGLLFRNVKDDSFDKLKLHVLNINISQ